MIILGSTGSLLRVITSASCTLDVHVSYVDITISTGAIAAADELTTLITTATTTTILGSPGSGVSRSVSAVSMSNMGAAAVDVTPLVNDGTNIANFPLTTLAPRMALQYEDGTGWKVLDARGTIVTSVSVADQVITAATLTLITGSLIAIPVTAWQVGLTFKWEFYADKTAAGTLASTIFVRAGTAGTTSDAIVAQFSTGTGTAAVDTGMFDILFTVRTVGASATAMSNLTLAKNAGTIVGWSVLPTISVNGTMSAFNTTTATFIHVSITSGTSVAPTVKSCIGRVV